MKNSVSILLMLLTSLFLQGCIHTYPDAEAPEEMEVAFDLQFSLSWGEILEYYPSSRSATSLHRFIVELYADGREAGRVVKTATEEEFRTGRLIVPVGGKLSASEYDVAVWCDRADADTGEPSDFDASGLLCVAPLSGFTDTSSPDACASASARIDLRPYKGTHTARLLIPVELHIPAACVRFVATDVEDFLNTAASDISHGETYALTVSFEVPFPTTFNAVSGEPSGYYREVEFTSPLPPLFSTENTLFRGWLFAQDSSGEMSVTLTLFNSARAVVSRVRNVEFPVERGKVTTVKGAFLTRYHASGITVDNIWDEDLIYNID